MNSSRAEVEIFSDLEAICTSAGFIHAIAYFCWRDNLIRYRGAHVVEKDLDHKHSQERLLRTEISTLIGLMAKQPLDLMLPTPSTMQHYIDRTERLLLELHHALTIPWSEWFHAYSEENNRGALPPQDPFDSASALREPIFYSGESAYGFQYHEFAKRKYRDDNPWLETKRGFRIEDACKIAEAIGKLQTHRLAEGKETLKALPADQWTFLPAFTFTAQEAAEASGVATTTVESFLGSFSLRSEDRNSTFTALNEFNVTNSTPILKSAPDAFILLQHYSLVEAIYETPFFWMCEDKAYSPVALNNRGRFLESVIEDRLQKVFGSTRTLRNIDIYKGKNRIAEVDALVLYGDRAIISQAKSKRLTIEARKGNDLRLKDDFQKAIQNAYDQAVSCANALMNDGFDFKDQSGAEITIGNKPKIVFPLCIVADHYPALAFQTRQFLKTSVSESLQPPLVIDIFSLDVITELLDSPLHFLSYLALRARFNEKIVVNHELAILGFHLKINLWLNSEHDMVNIGDDFTNSIDIAMMARRGGVPGKATPDGILTRYDNLSIGRVLREIEKFGSAELTGLGLLLLQLSSKAGQAISRGIDRILGDARRDGKNHDISVGLGEAKSGITIHCNSTPENLARERLTLHCRLRKYDTKANSWYGLLLDSASGAIRGALVNEDEWRPDPKMDAVVAAWPRRPPVPISALSSAPRKIGRNEPCPCGSGKKYKKCCLVK